MEWMCFLKKKMSITYIIDYSTPVNGFVICEMVGDWIWGLYLQFQQTLRSAPLNEQ